MMMKFAQFMCGHCRMSYDSHVDSAEHMPCPTCGQFNPVVSESPTITGRCDFCNRPLESDGHVWFRDVFIECRNAKR